jgi:8-oxo-dGTP diphosphatase
MAWWPAVVGRPPGPAIDWIAAVATFPIRDRAGNALTGLRFGAEDELTQPVVPLAMPASLVVVIHANTVLMMFDSWREQWELPGGMREKDETARQAAVRELHEETGIQARNLTFAAVAEFDLVAPERRELLAIYHLHLQAVPTLTTNDEALDFQWWPPGSPIENDMSPLDAEIARRVLHFPSS